MPCGPCGRSNVWNMQCSPCLPIPEYLFQEQNNDMAGKLHALNLPVRASTQT